MASRNVIAALVVIFEVTLPTLSRATEHVVGDDNGWTLGFNYTAWAHGKEFRVGDTLVFKYRVGYHNVFKVSGPDFQACKVPPVEEALTSGNDVITLATPGRKWYICGVGNGTHCQAGQKLLVTVLPAEWQAPSPSPSASYVSHSHSPSPAMSWEAPSPSAGTDASSPAPSGGATPSSPHFFFNRFLKYCYVLGVVGGVHPPRWENRKSTSFGTAPHGPGPYFFQTPNK